MFRRLLPAALLLAAASPVPADSPAAPRAKLYVTNSAGDDVTIIDPGSNKVIGRIVVGPHPHGIAAPRDGRFLLVTLEGARPGQLVWIDTATDKVTGRMNIGPAPNQLAVTPDGSLAYVPVDDGHYEVVDVAKKKIVTRIRTGGRPHNTVCSPDGRFAYLAPMGAPKRVTVIDTATQRKVGEIPFGGVVRPVCLSPDGKWLFAQVDPLIGFEAADLSKGKVVHRVAAQVTAGKEKVRSRSHGLGVRPDGKELWGCDVDRQEVQVFDLTGERPRQVAAIPLGNRVYWLTFSPDGRTSYVSVHGHDEVAVIDTATKEVKARVKVGKGPKRLLVVTPPR